MSVWAVDGARMPAAIARQETYRKTNGARGINLPGDLKVRALAVPGGAIRIDAGGATSPNDYIADHGGQSYGMLKETEGQLNVPATGSTGGATWYVVYRVQDPQYGDNLPVGADPATFEYDYFELVSSIANIPYPHVVLAKITMPANTATITQAMITDLRKIANPQRWSEMFTYALTTGTEDQLNVTSNYPDGGETWPEATETAWGEIDIPEWATHMRIKMTWAQVRFPGGDAWGYAWVQVAPTVNADNFKTQAVTWDADNSTTPHRVTIIAADDKAIPTALRGTSQKIYPRATVNGGVVGGRPKLDATSAMILEVEFYSKAV